MVALRRFFGFKKRIEDAGVKARRIHGDWLTKAIFGGGAMPRIPVRKISEGGYEHVRRTETGRAWADSWWSGAFRKTD